MPPHVLGQAVDVLEELPGQARLADAAGADDADEPGAALPGRGVELVLQLAQLLVPAHEGCLERSRSPHAAALRHDAERAPRRYRSDLALEHSLTGLFEDDRPRGRPLRRLPHQHGTPRSDRLQAAGGVDEVPADHALVGRTDRDGGFSGHDTHAGFEPLQRGVAVRHPDAADSGDQLQAGPDRPFGIVLAGRGRAPQGHHRIADELLHPAAVALDDLRHGREVAILQGPDLLGIAALGKGGEADEVSEEDGHQAPFGLGGGDGCGRRVCGRRGRDVIETRATGAAEAGDGLVGRTAAGTGLGQLRTAGQTEPARRRVPRAAIGAVHAHASHATRSTQRSGWPMDRSGPVASPSRLASDQCPAPGARLSLPVA